MNQWEYAREQASFREKIALAKLETTKAQERVRELEYSFARFGSEVAQAIVVEHAKHQVPQGPHTPVMGLNTVMGDMA